MSNARFSILQARAVKDNKITDSQFRTLAALGMYANEDGWCFPSLETIGRDRGKSKQAVGRDTIALKKLGYLEVYHRTDKVTGGRRSNMYRLRFDFPIPNQHSVDGASTSYVDGASTSEVDINVPSTAPSNARRNVKIKPAPDNMPLDWLIASGANIPEEALLKAQAEKLATDTFEKAFGFGSLPWASNTPWEKFYRWVVKIHGENPGMFQEYAEWRDGPGKYKAMSNKQIRMNPQTFIDTGYPEFEASKMNAKPKEIPQEPPRSIPASWQKIYDETPS